MTSEECAVRVNVSRETMDRLLKYDAVLMAWSDQHNLVSKSSLDFRWSRHYLDSLQLYSLLPAGSASLVDLGSGAGFPGLVLAACGLEDGLTVRLIESTGKKAAFLREAIAAMEIGNCEVVPARIEAVKIDPPEIVTARALSSLDKLCAYGHGIAARNTRFFFPKGIRAEEELTQALKSWRMDVTRHQSMTDKDATIFEITNLVSRS